MTEHGADGVLDLAGIRELIPHRYPFLLVDRILECEPGKRLVGIKNVTAGEPFFQGHFPDYPVMPGVLVIEALAQAGTVMMLQDSSDRGIPFLAGLDKVRFRRPVVPGDQLRLELEVLQKRPGSCRVAGKAFVGGDLAAQAEIFAVLKPADS